MTGDDHARLGDDAERLVTWLANEAFMRLELVDGPESPRRCAALALDPRLGTFACSIYATRPQVCRDLERGSGACRGELATKGERSRRALVMLASRVAVPPAGGAKETDP